MSEIWKDTPGGWIVHIDRLGTGFSVYPGKSLLAVENWALNPHHRRHVGAFAANVWRFASGAYLRREYPKNDRQLRKALDECEAFCRHEDDAERRAAAMIESMVRTIA